MIVNGKYKQLYLMILVFFTLVSIFYSNDVFAVEDNKYKSIKYKSNPVEFLADEVIYSEKEQKITAIGNVEFVQDKKILKANKVIYDLHTDSVLATGNVTLLDSNGDVHFADELKLNHEMKDGFISGLISTLSDGSRFTAKEARRIGGMKTSMIHASYTPCKICEENRNKAPIWQIKADKVVYDEEKQNIFYKNARFEFLGVPVGYTPIFSHPGPKKKQKSGFLRPKAGWTSRVGTFVKAGYYWGIAPDKDFTFYLQPTTRQGVLSLGEYRQRFKNGKINIRANAAIDSTRTEESGIIETNNSRAAIDAEGRFDLNDIWRVGFNLNRASDKEYLRLYNISNKNILESQIFAERFLNRNYTRIEAISFQDVRLGDRLVQPEIFPWLQHKILSKPNSLLGGRLAFNVDTVGLYRSGNEQDVFRAAIDTSWEKQHIFLSGVKTIIEAKLRGDIFAVGDYVEAIGSNSSRFRLYPYIYTKTSYPFAKKLNNSDLIIEPIASITIAGDVNNNSRYIPNEDSIDVQLDMNNLFEASRFPGYDRLEDTPHGAFGIKTGIYRYNGWYGEAFIGQSVQFDAEDGLFPNGSGLEDKYSDIIGQVSIGLGNYLDMDYKLQVDNQNLSARRHELVGFGTYKRIDYNVRYIYANTVSGTGFEESREQLQFGGGYQLNDNWRFGTASLIDLGAEPGLRKASAGLYYNDECFSFSIIGSRNLINRASGENETSVFVRFGLKNLGEFSTPKILLDTTVDKTNK